MEGLAVKVGIRVISCPSETSVPTARAHPAPVDADRQRQRQNREEANATAYCAREGRNVMCFLLARGSRGHDGGREVGRDDGVAVGERESRERARRVQAVEFITKERIKNQ